VFRIERIDDQHRRQRKGDPRKVTARSAICFIDHKNERRGQQNDRKIRAPDTKFFPTLNKGRDTSYQSERRINESYFQEKKSLLRVKVKIKPDESQVQDNPDRRHDQNTMSYGLIDGLSVLEKKILLDRLLGFEKCFAALKNRIASYVFYHCVIGSCLKVTSHV